MCGRTSLLREDAAQTHQFILHAALDIVQDHAWTTSAMYLKAIDRFNDLVVSVYVTAVDSFPSHIGVDDPENATVNLMHLIVLMSFHFHERICSFYLVRI
ncbi:TRAFFICKING PROTEIN PARTICLE COMPLEX SUBUNIT 2 [Salix purpurea]|uniref:TRAFFICKING PROTEIN PARTICLE COMPLEX SUBUNIT 2 n=1 Tax=Salix purpurea TaxID=77065 RepID=A0A9Q0YWX8_SALPP|nr:TRAFFICKING PROTEIN PARTICLE COMPLEX SUBUNIT 2 [Salix purpurea]